MRVAVIGSGISGLVAARELDRAGVEVTVFEAEERIGGHSHTVTVESETGSWDVDTGFIVLNDRNYPSFEALLAELGVETQPAPMSFSVSDGRGRLRVGDQAAGAVRQALLSRDPRFRRMLADLVRFNREARELVGTNGAGGSLRDFLAAARLLEYFVERLIVPQASAVWSARPSSYPRSRRASWLSSSTTTGLCRSSAAARLALDRGRLPALRRGADRAPSATAFAWRRPSAGIRRGLDRVDVATDAGTECFDEVVVAVHSDQALAMLADPSVTEREVLGAIPYQRNEVALHTDTSVLPRRRRAWASWNFHLPAEGDAHGEERTTVTYDMNILQRLEADREFLVTLNRTDAIDPERIIRTMSYSHPVYTDGTVRAQARWEHVSGRNRTHYCGAYWGWGFHEDGVRSALRVSRRIASRSRPILIEPRSVEALAA